MLLVLASAGPASALSTVYPVESLGNRGSEVRALQYLLRSHGRAIGVDGVFGATTQAAVAAHQQAKGLPVTGVVDEATWRSLTPRLVTGDTGDAVARLARFAQDADGLAQRALVTGGKGGEAEQRVEAHETL